VLTLGLLASATAGLTCQPAGHPVEVGSGDCVTCHKQDYDATTSPKHDGEFPVTCGDCHSETSWRPAAYRDHEWPLEGEHAKAVCSACHTGDPPRYEGTPTACIDCHADDRAEANEPDHSGFSNDCGECHNPAGWKPAKFDHEWPLEGKHATVVCAGCHGDPPTYEGTPTACVDCHREDYDSSPYPGHSAFATTCQDCHTTTAWKPASGSHPESKFPIKSGAHKVVDCMDCHNATLGPNGKGNADCVGCHTGHHRRSVMDPKHHEVAKYPSGDAPPNFCLDCHPSGRH
jgi:hypothetical protein